ncbi:hypothetical protein [Oceanobacillus bengalensis]|uniref:Uncharacterized protein n=1 Tax=Oceanobacillus bengalensis TaxID=1435466 RepID=A0A494Z6J1_9BACI|nr:hypothetical protein [Oceanobacillus bengalensis]RKQ18173.1 hypothetical protein D8M05_01865 [Oceanobacillus bengalensis]
MGKRKKKQNTNTPRHKRLNRPRRLDAAKHWIPKYPGKNLVNGYSKHFAVNKLCAVRELEMIGYNFDDNYKQKLKDAELQKQIQTERRKEAKRQQFEEELWEDSDETFAFIAGYTDSGAPYGITWEEWNEEIIPKKESRTKPNKEIRINIHDDDLPF